MLVACHGASLTNPVHDKLTRTRQLCGPENKSLDERQIGCGLLSSGKPPASRLSRRGDADSFEAGLVLSESASKSISLRVMAGATFGVWRPHATRLVLSQRGAIRSAEAYTGSEQAVYGSAEGLLGQPQDSLHNEPDKLILDVVPSESAEADILARAGA